jgi:hypothetical protein
MSSSNLLTRTYELRRDAPPPMRWANYEQKIIADWELLLNSEEGCDGSAVHLRIGLDCKQDESSQTTEGA